MIAWAIKDNNAIVKLYHVLYQEDDIVFQWRYHVHFSEVIQIYLRSSDRQQNGCPHQAANGMDVYKMGL